MRPAEVYKSASDKWLPAVRQNFSKRVSYMVSQPNDGLKYLQMYPHLWKWMNRCLTCGHIGYKPDFPERMGVSHAPHHIRRYFPEVALNGDGLCEQCAVANKHGKTGFDVVG